MIKIRLTSLRWKPVLKQRKQLLRKMLIICMFASVIPVIAVGFGSYLFSASAVKDEVNQANIRLLTNASYSIDSTLQRIQSNATQMLLGSFFSTGLAEAKQKDYAGFYSSLNQNMSALMYSNREASDIAVYLADDDYLLSQNNGTHRVQTEKERKELQNALNASGNMRWTNEPISVVPGSSDFGATLICKFPLNSTKPLGLLFISIDHRLFNEIMNRYIRYPGEQMFILNAEGKLVSYFGDPFVPEGLYNSDNQSKKRYTFRWNHENYMVTPITSSYNQWQYIDMVPEKELNAKSNSIALFTIAFVIVVLVLGILFIYMGTWRIYRPIERLIHDVRGSKAEVLEMNEVDYVRQRWAEINQTASELQKQWDDQFPVIRELFALQLLHGHFHHYSAEQLEQLLARYGIPGEQEFQICMITYDPLPQNGRFREHDQDLVLFSIKNISQDLLRTHGLQGIVINLLNDHIALYMYHSAEEPSDWFHTVKAFAEQLRTHLSNYLHLPVTIGISHCSDHLEELPQLYQEAMLAVRSRLTRGGDQVIQLIGNSMNMDVHYRYPVEIETHFENSLRLGEQEEAERLLEEFTRVIEGIVHRPELIQMSYQQLATAAMRTAYLLGIPPDKLFDPEEQDPYAQMRGCHSIQDLNRWMLNRLIRPIVDSVQGAREQESEQLIWKVVHYIERNYHLDLSLEQCAQICGLNPRYFSKRFKKTMNESFIDYLTRYRIEQAVSLLRDTTLTVSEISERVGYQTKNFIRVFKKLKGITPGKFRESSGKMEST